MNVSVCNGQKIKAELVSQNLASLFEYTEDPYRILETTERKSAMLVEPPKANKKALTKTEEVRREKPAEPPKIMAKPEVGERAQPAAMPNVTAEPSVNPTGAQASHQLS